jgi:tetratricopeptide (TPR) repeat protein
VANPHRRFQLFVSSRIDEFVAERAAIESVFNGPGLTSHFMVWVYELAGSEPGAGDDQYIPELKRSHAALFLIGEDVSPAVRLEFDVARKQNLKCIGLIVRGIEHSPAACELIAELRNECRTQDVDRGDSLVAAARIAVRNIEQEILEREFERARGTFGSTVDVSAQYRVLRDHIVDLCNAGEIETAKEEIGQRKRQETNSEAMADLVHLEAFTYRRMHDFDRALGLHDQAMALNNLPRYEFAKVDTLYCAGRDAEAVALFETISEEAKQETRAKLWSVRLALDQQRYEEAFVALKNLRCSRTEEPFDFWSCWGGLAQETGHYHAAIKAYERAVRSMPSAAPLAKLGLVDALYAAAVNTGQDGFVSRFKREVATLSRESFDNLLVNRGLQDHIDLRLTYQECRLLELERRPDEARAKIREYLERKPDDLFAQGFMQYWEARHHLGRTDVAEGSPASTTTPERMKHYNAVLLTIGSAATLEDHERISQLITEMSQHPEGQAHAALLRSFHAAVQNQIFDARQNAWAVVRNNRYPYHARLAAALHLLEMSQQLRRVEEAKSDFETISALGLRTFTAIAIVARAYRASAKTLGAEESAARRILGSIGDLDEVAKNEAFSMNAVHVPVLSTLPADIRWAFARLDRSAEGELLISEIFSGFSQRVREELKALGAEF